MPGGTDPFSDLQAKIKTKLNATTFFSTAPAIDVITEAIGDIEARITASVAKIGCCVLIVTPVGDVQNANSGGLIFSPINIVIRVFENVTVNRSAASGFSKQPASWIAIAAAYALHGWTPSGFNGPINVKGLALGNDPRRFTYDVIAEIEFAIGDAPERIFT